MADGDPTKFLLVTDAQAAKLAALLNLDVRGEGCDARLQDNCIMIVVPTPPRMPVGDVGDSISGLITGNAAGAGKYTGKTFGDPTADVPASGDLAESDFGTLAEAEDCLILNAAELGFADGSHWVTQAYNTDAFAIYFAGRLVRVNSDGKKVIQVYMPFRGC